MICRAKLLKIRWATFSKASTHSFGECFYIVLIGKTTYEVYNSYYYYFDYYSWNRKCPILSNLL